MDKNHYEILPHSATFVLCSLMYSQTWTIQSTSIKVLFYSGVPAYPSADRGQQAYVPLLAFPIRFSSRFSWSCPCFWPIISQNIFFPIMSVRGSSYPCPSPPLLRPCQYKSDAAHNVFYGRPKGSKRYKLLRKVSIRGKGVLEIEKGI